ncbi:major facilitator superfamily transporter nicotinic acid transporter [Grosmannia clavigera kw1407]|uniref:Major facilitator superfamily transporter nicotinic acid transporter n=1 Tax=Grosmannia clavigera (strain kw1407 / UAMH 11150) TaxID=655863 RepID=F0X9Q4_GROCL|nr:major facilitator superfamily transporter nicotinic acid transporter [Grosmannia clavigera kw1407]EFX06176.1 major facilitator superfamily transporter nicotinic acid transporter [Grosmannia clavigera kw1407]
MTLTEGKAYSIEQVEAALSEKTSNGADRGLNSSNQPLYNDKETTRVLHKVDWRLVPVLTLLYTVSFLDKGNIGNAKVAGMTRDLHMTGTQYNIALTMFFFPYAVFEIPSNIVLKLMRPSLWLTILVIAWGIVMTCQGTVQNYHGLLVTRILLGFFEAGFFPASTYLLGDWYCRFELQWRLSVFFSASSMAGAFSGLLAFAIEKMDGIGKLAGWRWIYILEGIATVLIGCVIPWILPDSPERASFLTSQEKEFIRNRLEQDSGTSSGRVQTADPLKWAYVWAAVLDWKIWFTVFIYWGNT